MSTETLILKVQSIETSRYLERIRKFNLYYLSFVSFVIAYGRFFQLGGITSGKHPENLLIIPILLTLYLIRHETGYNWPITYREKIFAAYTVFISLMPLWGVYLDRSLDALRDFWGAAAFGILVMYIVRDVRELKILVFFFLFGTMVRGAVNAFEFSQTMVPASTPFRSQNGYAHFMLGPLALVFCLTVYLVSSRVKKTGLFIAFVILFVALLATMARAPILAFLFSMALFSVIFNRKAAILAVSVIMLISSSVYLFPNSAISQRIKSVKWEDSSLQSRVKGLWPAAIAVYKDHNPVWGIGSGGYTRMINTDERYKATAMALIGEDYLLIVHVHNEFLQALVTQGIIGVLIYLFFIYQISFMSWKVFTSSSDTFLKAIGAAGIIWIIGHCIAGMVHHELLDSRSYMGLALMISIIIISYYSVLRLNLHCSDGDTLA
jgi:O-antigen ligase